MILRRRRSTCREGGTSFHGCGIHPGFVGDILPLTLTRLMNRIDRIEVSWPSGTKQVETKGLQINRTLRIKERR